MRRVVHVTRVFFPAQRRHCTSVCCSLRSSEVELQSRTTRACLPPLPPALFLISSHPPSPLLLVLPPSVRSLARHPWSMIQPFTLSTIKSAARRNQRATKHLTSTLSSPKYARSYSSAPRPYCFHVGASWAGKPHDPRGPRVKTAPFSPDSPVGRWRDVTLSRPTEVGAGAHVGEDFFFVQDVSLSLCSGCPRHRRHHAHGVNCRKTCS